MQAKENERERRKVSSSNARDINNLCISRQCTHTYTTNTKRYEEECKRKREQKEREKTCGKVGEEICRKSVIAENQILNCIWKWVPGYSRAPVRTLSARGFPHSS